MEKNFFVKTHGLGNDYIVLDSEKLNFVLHKEAIIRICDVHYGIGSDGILLKIPASKADFGVKILNPDGSEAEKSGNGLRIYSKFLYDYGYTRKKEFTIDTLGGLVKSQIIEEDNHKAKIIRVDMGKAIFASNQVPVKCTKEECIDESLSIKDKQYIINCVSVGNPHCVILKEDLDEDEIKEYGPLLENNNMFPNRINVQFVKPVSRERARAIIWERGAGYTLASGSSSCAVAAILVKKGLADPELNIEMPGGTLGISIDDSWNIRMTGEVREIASGILSNELINDC